MKNKDIRDKARIKDVRLWEVAERMAVSDSTFSKMLRKEFSEEKKQQAIQYIDDIARERR